MPEYFHSLILGGSDVGLSGRCSGCGVIYFFNDGVRAVNGINNIHSDTPTGLSCQPRPRSRRRFTQRRDERNLRAQQHVRHRASSPAPNPPFQSQLTMEAGPYKHPMMYYSDTSLEFRDHLCQKRMAAAKRWRDEFLQLEREHEQQPSVDDVDDDKNRMRRPEKFSKVWAAAPEIN